MSASTITSIEEYLDNMTIDHDASSYLVQGEIPIRRNAVFIFLSKWFLRVTCVFVIFACPWVNYKLIQFFQIRPFYKESSAKWYIIFKALFDTLYILISIPIILSLTFNVDVIHKNIFTCKSITYIHYLSDDLISILLALLCIDRMARITCGCRLRQRVSLIICIIAVNFFLILNIHHIIRLQHRDGFCHKVYLGIWDYDFDIYYSFIYTTVTWIIIFISSINLAVSVYCDRSRRIQLQKQTKQQQQQEQKISQIFLTGGEPIGGDSDRVELIRSTDDWDDPTGITIEQNHFDERSFEQDNIELQITVCVLITAAIFLGCNLPNFIIYVMRYVYDSSFSTIGYIFVYISLFPLLIAHTISYFIYNHLAARIFRNNSS